MQLSRFFAPHSPEEKAKALVLGLGVGFIICWIANLPGGLFAILAILSMWLMGMIYIPMDLARENAGEAPVALRTLFWRGASEAGLGFALMLMIEGARAII
ncbi:MAG: hypothetical protein R3C27_01795 [Hyphomonadaceae bacterium]